MASLTIDTRGVWRLFLVMLADALILLWSPRLFVFGAVDGESDYDYTIVHKPEAPRVHERCHLSHDFTTSGEGPSSPAQLCTFRAESLLTARRWTMSTQHISFGFDGEESEEEEQRGVEGILRLDSETFQLLEGK